MKFCVGITTYYPSKSIVEKIELYNSIFDHVFIYDNTPNSNLTMSCDSITIVKGNGNEGIAVAFNRLMTLSEKEEYDYMLLLDQDSEISSESCNRMINFLRCNPDVKICVPKVIYKNNVKTQEKDLDVALVDWAITSGTFIYIPYFIKLGGYDENYFIDRIDADFSRRVLDNNERIYCLNTAKLYQELGEKTFSLFKLKYSPHNSIRNYYISRNRFYFYKKFNLNKFYANLLFYKQIILIILFDKNKIEKIKYSKLGKKDYLMGKMGKYNGIEVEKYENFE